MIPCGVDCGHARIRRRSKHPQAEPGALASTPLKAAGKAFSGSASGSVSQSLSGVGSQKPIATLDCDPDADADRAYFGAAKRV